MINVKNVNENKESAIRNNVQNREVIDGIILSYNLNNYVLLE